MGVVGSSMQGDRTASNNTESKEIAIDRHTLEAYLQLERDIAREETNNPLHPLELKSSELKKLTADIEEKETLLKEIEEKTTKEKEDVQAASSDVKTTLMDFKPNFIEENLSPEQGEYLATLNKQ
ncbi:hypothetical protein FHG87_023983, partial [Trinorchestia longiramus]